MKIKKIIALSAASLLVGGLGLTLGVTIGLNDLPTETPGFVNSSGANMSWSDLITGDKPVVNVQDDTVKSIDKTELDKICPGDNTFTLEIPEEAGITEIDHDAFVVVTDAYEVFGGE